MTILFGSSNFAYSQLFGGNAVANINNTNIVGKGDSIARGQVYASDLGAIQQMGLTGTGSIVVTNLGVNSSRATTHLDEIASGQLSAYWLADRPCVLELQGGTNDIGEFATATPGMSGLLLYHYQMAAARLAKALGWYVVGRTLTPRGDAFMTAPKQSERTNNINFLALNSENSFDGIVDLRFDPRVGEASGVASNPSEMPDSLHPSASLQTYLGTLLRPKFLEQAVKPPRTNRTVADCFSSAPTYGIGRFGLGMTSGGTFINTPVIPFDLLPRPITLEVWIKTTTINCAIMGQRFNGTNLPIFTLAINASGQVYVNINNGQTTITCPTIVTDNNWHYVRLVVGSASTKLETDGTNQVNTTTIIPSGDTRAVRYFSLDPENGVSNFVGTMSGLASWNGDRSGIANPTNEIGLNTPNLRGFYPLAHLKGWN